MRTTVDEIAQEYDLSNVMLITVARPPIAELLEQRFKLERLSMDIAYEIVHL